MQDFIEVYNELSEMLAEIEGVKWIDLWHNQVNFLDVEHPFPAPAIFLAFRSDGIEDARENIQHVKLQIEAYLFYETFADTYHGSVNKTDAVEFLALMNEIHKTLHGTDGESYSGMRRVDFRPVDTGSAGNLYQITFQCELVDASAKPVFVDAGPLEMIVSKETPDEIVPPEDDEPMFILPG
jgi:hypothetical protein